MRVLVTGAHGCIGAWVVKQLLDESVDVVIYDIENNSRRLSLILPEERIRKAEVHVGSIEDIDRVKSLVRGRGITHIVHLAGVQIPFCQANPVLGGLANVIGTLNVFEAARDAGSPVKLVYASSAAVWGPEEAYGDRPISDSDVLLPSTHYGVFKQANEGNARAFYMTERISSIGLRPWSVYGVGRDTGLTSDPTIAARSVVLKQPFCIRISGRMDMQYVEDVAAAFVQCARSSLEGAYAFNLAGDVVGIETIIDVLDELRPGASSLITASGTAIPVAPRLDATSLHRSVPGIPKTTLLDGFRRTLEHFERLHGEGRLCA